MRLLIDLGNTRLKWAWQTEGKLTRSDAVVYELQKLPNELPIIWQDLDTPGDIWISSVAQPDVQKILDAYFKNQWGITAQYIHASRSVLGVTNSYIEPQRLGSDRWLAMLAAYQYEGRCVMVIDCGSAVTIDAVDADGTHIGGVIAPGIALSNSVLNRQTSLRWQPSAGILPVKVFTNSTAEAIASGIGNGVIGLVEMAYRELVHAGHHPVVYLTGGDATYISHALSIEHKQVDDLVLQGLAMFANHA